MSYPARPLLFALDAERAHHLTIAAMKRWGASGLAGGPEQGREVTIAGLTFPNPVGLAAGLDKDAQAIDGFLGLGFGHVEVGTLTPRPQPGNPRPRLFRLREDDGIINRMGFNNGGIDAALPRIRAAKRKGVLGVNVGANKDSTDRIADYAHGVAKAAPHADYVTINVSSPNTPGLRDLQDPAMLRELLAGCDSARSGEWGRRPLFLKVAPDLENEQLRAITETAIAGKADALIVGNTTISRPASLTSGSRGETGGLSGAPLRRLAREKLEIAVEAAAGALPIIAAGGVDSAEEARLRLAAGATLVQLYSALIYHGPGLPRRIVRGLA
ncbi:quinone-dependent dihydroorotate dehydrogenase [Stakelama pacifica]|uniref:Dihydroorotate dehydrogenase (quinone) n=1 Tax=Stakelama pacifica TaxID=517720 RepID=A0A4R6FSB5_9SPHN|nr:quinone-dependent dihydroorotate dehydrogenase [Stakelama pacifica]TDN83665.1 dihydroorotate oxidase A [Stakelama pacifica]GGO94466.1 dihydroorotate dehydrogenase (quinone) [Stakelama pacifica]